MYKKNLELLQKNYPPYYEIIRNYETPIDEEIQLEEVISLNGSENLKVKTADADLFLHSNYNPHAEVQKWIKAIDPENKLFIVIGGGYYYHLNELLDLDIDNKTIIVIEPSVDIFRKALENVDLTNYLTNRNLILMVSKNADEVADGLLAILYNIGVQSLGIYPLLSYRQIFHDFYVEVLAAISNLIKLFDVNLATVVAFSQRWIYNQFQNVREINKNTIPLSEIFGSFKGIPAVVAGAGPSLEKQLELLKQNESKILVLSAGSSVNILEKNDIEPHIQVAIDGGINEDKIIGGIKSKKTKLAYFPNLSCGSIKLFKGKKFWYKGTGYSSINFFEKFIGLNTTAVEMGPSCVHSAVDIAIKMGCNPIILIGQDMAYTNQQLYAKGAALYDSVNEDVRDRIVVKDLYGNETTTNSSFMAIKMYFESYVKQHDNVDYINCTEGGLGIEGVINEKFEQIVQRYDPLNIDIFEELDDKFRQVKQELDLKYNLEEKIDEFIKFVEDQARDVEAKSKERLDLVEEILENLESVSIDEIRTKVELIDEITRQIEDTDVHSEIMHFSVFGYIFATRHTAYKELEGISELKEKYRVLLMGLKKQYSFYYAIIGTIVSSIENANANTEG